jgi:hypothetical protein
MPPIVGAIAGALAGLGTLGTALVTLAASVALSALSAALTKKDAAESGSQFSVKFGGDRPRTAILGRGAEAGHMLDCFTYGSDNKKMMYLLALGDGWHGSITHTWIGGNPVYWDGALGTTWRSSGSFQDGGSKLRIKYYDGRFDQAADTDLIAASGGRWTSNDRLRGIAYVLIDVEYNEKLELTGVPEFLFAMEGLKLYDPRKDSTVDGGSGSHRWGEPATYETTTNAAIIEYNVRRGIYINDQLIFGLGLPSGDLLHDTYIAAANDCDEPVPLAAGGTEPRYLMGTHIDAQQPVSEVLARIRTAMAGYIVDRAGEFAILTGVTQSVAGTFSDEDAIVGQPISFSRFRPRPEVATAVHGNFSDPLQQWQSVDFPPREDEDDDAAMGERLTRTNDYSMVFSVSQAQRLAEIDRRLSMLQANGSITLPAKFIVMQPGDWWTYDSGRWGERTVQITDVTLNANLTVTISWREIDAYAYNWSTAGEIEYAPNPIAPGRGTLITAVPSFAVEPGTAIGEGGVQKPIIKASWTPIADPTVDGIIVEYRKVDDDEVLTFLASDPGIGFANISSGVQHLTDYEARARIVTTPQRGWTWTSWLPVTATEEVTGPAIGVVPGGVTPEALAPEILDRINVEIPSIADLGIQRADDAFKLVQDTIASVALVQEQTRRQTEVVREEGAARVSQAFNTAASDTAAEASIRFAADATLQSAIDTTNASAALEILARSTGDSALAQAATDLSAQTEAGRAAIGQLAIVVQNATASLGLVVETLRAQQTSDLSDSRARMATESMVRATEVLAEASTRFAADATLQTNIDGVRTDSAAALATEQLVRATADTATAMTALDLAAQIGGGQTTLNQLAVVVQNLTASVGLVVETMRAQFQSGISDSRAMISNESLVRATDILAEAAQRLTLRAEMLGLTSANTTATAAVEARTTTAEGAITTLGGQYSSLDSRMTSAEGVNTAQATTLTSYGTRITSAEGTITSQASTLSSLSATVGGHTSSISTNASAIATQSGYLATAYVLKLDGNGRAGLYLATGGGEGDIVLSATRLKIETTAGSSVSPFSVSGSTVTMQNVQIDGNLTVAGTITTGKLATNAATELTVVGPTAFTANPLTTTIHSQTVTTAGEDLIIDYLITSALEAGVSQDGASQTLAINVDGATVMIQTYRPAKWLPPAPGSEKYIFSSPIFMSVPVTGLAAGSHTVALAMSTNMADPSTLLSKYSCKIFHRKR